MQRIASRSLSLFEVGRPSLHAYLISGSITLREIPSLGLYVGGGGPPSGIKVKGSREAEMKKGESASIGCSMVCNF